MTALDAASSVTKGATILLLHLIADAGKMFGYILGAAYLLIGFSISAACRIEIELVFACHRATRLGNWLQ